MEGQICAGQPQNAQEFWVIATWLVEFDCNASVTEYMDFSGRARLLMAAHVCLFHHKMYSHDAVNKNRRLQKPEENMLNILSVRSFIAKALQHTVIL